MGIYERDLSSFDERPLIENTQFEGCVNCHSFNRGNPADMSLHIRGPHGATLLRHDNSQLIAYNTKTDQTLGFCVYPYWHPSGRYIAYSTNSTSQLFHSADPNRIEVFDTASDLQVYDVEKNELLLSPLLKQDSIYETFPVFSADGRSLYFCAARALPEGSHQLDSLHYNLCRIDFDPATGTYGDHIDIIVDAETQNKSVSFPRPSYDGRFLCYTLSDYGQFSIWHHEADLYLLDLSTGESQPMTAANSEDTESFHNWSTNSRWLVLSSRRDDGLFTRPYFCHVDAKGTVSKAFMLPQRNPRRFYRERFLSFNVPDFIIGPTNFDGHQASGLINENYRKDFNVRKAAK
jgi:Tol biopolymer transport system component